MEMIARPKLVHLSRRRFIRADFVEVFDQHLGTFDAVISSYAIHHLTGGEKQILFAKIRDHLNDEGCAVMGDLMVANAENRRDLIEKFRVAGDSNTVESLEGEFFWQLDEAVADLVRLGFSVITRPFSALSYVVTATRARQVSAACASAIQIVK
jgi:cyclopropane fatty-acyl-phospholipid synthase-like methyltransferase